MTYSATLHIKRVLIAIDQFVNACIYGDPDESLSSRMGKKLVLKKNCYICKIVCGFLHWIDPNHCIDAIEHDEGEKVSHEPREPKN